MKSWVSFVLFALVAALFSPLLGQPAAAAIRDMSAGTTASATTGLECGCSLVGPYVNPNRGQGPSVSASGESPNGTYTVSASLAGTLVNLSIVRTGTTPVVFQTSIPSTAGWGFSPDDHRFVYHYTTGGVHNVFLRDLVANRQVWTTAVSTGSSRITFSPHGKYLLYSAITAASHAQLTMVNAVTGLPASHATEFTFSSPPGTPGDSFGVANWGWSPDAGDRTFVYAWLSGANSVEWSVVNLATRAVTHNETILSISGFWQFTKCGDVVGIVTQPFTTQVEIRLFKTETIGAALTDQTFPFAAVALRTTTASHIANVGGTDHTLAANTAGASCGGGVTPVALASVSVTPASVVGGTGTTGKITLTGAAPAGGFAVTLSSSSPKATFAANATVSQNLTTKSFPIATSAVTTNTNVTITATAGGVTKTATLTLTPPTGGGPAPGAGAVMALPSATAADGCRDTVLPANDDGSTSVVALPFTVNFFGRTFGSLYVNNNGNVTFDRALSTFTPFGLLSTSTPIIAPFFADVDTRGSGSDTVHYGRSFGATIIGGRQAFCVDWLNVGYYSAHTNKLNSFQLVIVDRSDVAAGDFDIYFNYDKTQWETGDASGGSNGLGGSPARVGYSNGVSTAFELPGSGASGAFLDSNTATGLVWKSRNSVQLGRYVFEVRNGTAPTGGSIGGTVYRNSETAGNELGAAFVQVCGTGGSCNLTTTNAFGGYSVSGLAPDSYTIRANGPGTSSLTPASIGPVALTTGASLSGRNLVLTGPTPPPSGTTITNRGTNPDGIPIIYWQDPLTLTTTGCAGGTASYELSIGASVVRSGAMTEGPSGTYTATIAALYPLHGYGRVVITILCGGVPTTVTFDIYIDPSGSVRTVGGAAITAATVTLYRSDNASGPFVQVEDGSGIMSPANRNNPDTTDAAGHFGWDVIAGFYVVRAEAADCVAPTNPAQAFVQTAVLTIPPPVTDLDLRLACAATGGDETAPTTTAAGTQAANAAGWNKTDVTVALEATDEAGGSGVRDITYALSGAQIAASQTVTGDTASTTITSEGTTTVAFFASDNANNVESSQSLTVMVDKTAPTVTTSRTPANANGWNNGPVAVHFEATDALSGVAAPAAVDATVSAQGANQSVEHAFLDLAGNPADASVGAISIDLTAPTTAASTSPTANASGWWRSAVTVSLAATDNLSGITLTEYMLDGGDWTHYTSPIAVSTAGMHTLRYRSTDRADNRETALALTIRIDLTAPEVFVQFDPEVFDIAVFGRDALSGVNAPIDATLAATAPGTGNTELRTYRVGDRADNSVELVVSVKRAGHEIKATLVSVRYNGGSTAVLPDNRLAFEWSLTSTGGLRDLNQKLDAGVGDNARTTQAKYRSDRDETTIRSDSESSVEDGLVLMRIVTASGGLAIEPN
jgi:hypothetical protein